MASSNHFPFEHAGPHGTRLRAERCDFVGGVTLTIPKHLSPQERFRDVAAIFAHHAELIRPELDNFTGYADLSFTIVET